MLSHYHGQTWNAADPARSLGVSEPTVRRYLDLLTGLFMVRQLKPWHANLAKRQVKVPKVYLRDCGLLHHLLGIRTRKDLLSHPKSGASWEGYALEELLKVADVEEFYFWGTHGGAELDLLLFVKGRRLGVEFKRIDAPRMTRSMHISLEDLALDHLAVIYPGKTIYPLEERVTVLPITTLAERGKLMHLLRGEPPPRLAARVRSRKKWVAAFSRVIFGDEKLPDTTKQQLQRRWRTLNDDHEIREAVALRLTGD